MDDKNFNEIPDEEVPEKLRRKWDREDYESEVLEKNFKPCPHCSKLIEPRSFSCIYCGERVFWDSGLLGGMLKHMTSQRGLFYFLILLAAAAIIISFVGI